MLFGDFAESESKSFKEATDEEESAEGYGYCSDSDLEDYEDEKVAESKRTAKPRAYSFDPSAISGKGKFICEGYEERVEKGKVVKIPDMAFLT